MLEIKNRTLIEVKKDERIYRFECASDSPLGEIFDALILMKNYVIQKMQEIDNQKEEVIYD